MTEGLDKNGRAFVSLAGIAVALLVAGAGAGTFIAGKDARAATPSGATALATAEQVDRIDKKLDRYEERLRNIEAEMARQEGAREAAKAAGYRK